MAGWPACRNCSAPHRACARPSGQPVNTDNEMTSSSAYDRRAVFAWSMYDFANSSFTTLVVTFIYATYFTKAIAPDELTGTTLWSRGVAIAAVVVALLSPPMGVLADRGGYRKLFLFIATAIAVTGSVFLYAVEPGQVVRALFWFVIANIAFEMGIVFYNAFLPDIAPPEKIGRISGYGWSLGYVGGLLAMAIAMVGLVNPETPWLGFSRETGENVRATNLLVAAWFALFSIPIFLWVKENRSPVAPGKNTLLASFSQLRDTLKTVGQYREIVKFLAARLFYNDGLITLFAFGGIYAAGTFGFSFEEIMVLGIVLNVAACLGAFALGFLDDLLGGKRTIQISLAGLILAGTAAVLAEDKTVFWVAAIVMGIFTGPNQAASRSLMGRLVPRNRENEFYGLFAFSGKATAFLGPLLLGELTRVFASQRAGVATILLFFISGLLILRYVDEAAGIRAAGRSS